MSETCKTCRWWKPVAEVSVQGDCRRYPPQFAPASDNNGTNIYAVYGYATWPDTLSHHFCGEWTPPPAQEDGER